MAKFQWRVETLLVLYLGKASCVWQVGSSFIRTAFKMISTAWVTRMIFTAVKKSITYLGT